MADSVFAWASKAVKTDDSKYDLSILKASESTLPSLSSLQIACARPHRSAWAFAVCLCAGLMCVYVATAGLEKTGLSIQLQQRRGLGYKPRLPAAQADLDAVLAGSWSAVDLAPLDTLYAALTKHLNGSEPLEGHSAELTIERKVYHAIASMPAIRTICEIGFNGGLSAALWLHGKGTIFSSSLFWFIFFIWPAVARDGP